MREEKEEVWRWVGSRLGYYRVWPGMGRVGGKSKAPRPGYGAGTVFPILVGQRKRGKVGSAE